MRKVSRRSAVRSAPTISSANDMSFFDELKRRKVFKVGVGYLVVAWLIVQVASIAFPAFDAPAWALRIFILVLLLGFPISLLFAWAFEVTPGGVKADRSEAGNK